MRTKAILLALAATLSLGSTAAVAQGTAGWREPDPENVLVVDTNKGRIIAELTPVTGPQNVARLKELARARFYDGRAFFRVVDGFMGVMMVGSQPDALMAMMTDGRVTAQARFCKGVLGMARTNEPNTANSQFFFMRDTRPDLDGKYTPVGRVLVGLDVVRALKVGEPVAEPQDRMTTVRLLSEIPAAERPRVLVRDTAAPEFAGVIQARGARFDPCDLDIEAVVQ